MAERHMSDKQYNCIAWICNTLGIEYNGTTSSYDAWKFISENKPLADKKMEKIEANRPGKGCRLIRLTCNGSCRISKIFLHMGCKKQRIFK